MRSFVGKVREMKKQPRVASKPPNCSSRRRRPPFNLNSFRLSSSHDPLPHPSAFYYSPKNLPQVISTAMMKTVMVAVERVAVVPKYKVTVRRTKKLMAHDESGKCLLGDTVRVESCRPLSKRKAWVVSEILRRERTLGGGGGEAAVAGAAAAAASSSPFSSSAASSRGFAASAFRHLSSS